MKENLKEKNGITLIALVITIIVMLILVAVTISLAIKGGLFTHAGKATSDMKNAQAQENELSKGKVKIDGIWYDSIDAYMNNVPSQNNEEEETEEPDEIEPVEETEEENAELYITLWFSAAPGARVGPISRGIHLPCSESKDFEGVLRDNSTELMSFLCDLGYGDMVIREEYNFRETDPWLFQFNEWNGIYCSGFFPTWDLDHNLGEGYHPGEIPLRVGPGDHLYCEVSSDGDEYLCWDDLPDDDPVGY